MCVINVMYYSVYDIELLNILVLLKKYVIVDDRKLYSAYRYKCGWNY